jgi:hypothetical protein
MHLTHCCLVLLLGSTSLQTAPPAGSAGQATVQKPTPPQQNPPPPKVNPEELPVSLDRIQKALANTPMLRFDEADKPIFRVQVFGEKPTIDDILGPDWATGPVKYGGLTHQEFLAMVTPKDIQGYGGLTNSEGATIAATSFALQWTLQKAIKKFKETQDAREREAARQEVLEALNALEKARAKAGGKL